MQDLYISLSIFLGFFTFYLLVAGRLSGMMGRRVCVLCFAASSTWITLLALPLAGFKVNSIILAIFLGGTTVGVTYQVEEFLLIYGLDLPTGLVKLVVFLVGVSGAYLYAAAGNLLGLALMGGVVGFGFFSLTPQRRRRRGKTENETEPRETSLSALIKKKLEDCC